MSCVLKHSAISLGRAHVVRRPSGTHLVVPCFPPLAPVARLLAGVRWLRAEHSEVSWAAIVMQSLVMLPHPEGGVAM